MAASLTPQDNYTFAGDVRFRNKPKMPDESIPDAYIDGPIGANKLEGEYSITHSQSGTVAAATEYLKVIHGTEGTVLAVEAAITETIATGADRTVTVDILKSTSAGAFASILTAPLVLDDGSVLRTVEAASIASAGLVAGDLLKLTVAVAGVAGAQAAGLVVTVSLREDAE